MIFGSSVTLVYRVPITVITNNINQRRLNSLRELSEDLASSIYIIYK